MICLLALVPATMLAVAGYAVFYLAHRSEGNLKTFGRLLGFWAFTLAALLVLACLFLAAHMGRMHSMMWMHGCPAQMTPGQEGPKPWGYLPPGNPPPPAAPSAQPAPPPPKAGP
jgi:heme/copper-type cytochrome/quinol oxidase subunit 1